MGRNIGLDLILIGVLAGSPALPACTDNSHAVTITESAKATSREDLSHIVEILEKAAATPLPDYDVVSFDPLYANFYNLLLKSGFNDQLPQEGFVGAVVNRYYMKTTPYQPSNSVKVEIVFYDSKTSAYYLFSATYNFQGKGREMELRRLTAFKPDDPAHTLSGDTYANFRAFANGSPPQIYGATQAALELISRMSTVGMALTERGKNDSRIAALVDQQVQRAK